MDDEPRYTPTELFSLYIDFMRDERERIERDDLHHCHYSELLLRFIAYVKNHDFEVKMREIRAEAQRFIEWDERRKRQMFGEPGDGTLFDPE
jgi:hypothetical protein